MGRGRVVNAAATAGAIAKIWLREEQPEGGSGPPESDCQAAGDTCERIMLSDLVGKQLFQ